MKLKNEKSRRPKNTAKKKKTKKNLDKLREDIALDEYSSSSGYGGWGPDD